MNLGMMQLSNVNMKSVANTKLNNTSQTTNSLSSNGVGNSFGSIFSKIMSNQTSGNEANSKSTDGNAVDLSLLSDLMNSDSIEGVLEKLGIPHDDGLLMIQNSEDQSAKSIDELMNLEDLLALLNMDQNQLQKVLEQFFSDEQMNGSVNDVWQLIQLVNEQASNFVNQITTALQGEHKVTPKESEQLLQLLKLAQMVGKNSDLINDQPIQVASLKDVMGEIIKKVEVSSEQSNVTTNTSQTSTKVNEVLQGFGQVVKQLETSTETQQTISGQQPIVTAPKTVTITLPAEKSSQGEALVKEIQQLIGRGQFSNTQGTMKLLLKLYPENLGSIRIEVMQKDGLLSVRLLASTSQAKELLDSQLSQLKTSFAQANIQMDRIDVAQSLQETDKNLRDQNLFSNFFKQQQDEEDDHDEQEDDEEQISFQDYLINEGV